MSEPVRETWSGRLAFILSAAGFSIGLGNLWRFPYLVGEYGGGIFLVTYIAACLLLGIPLYLIEITLGRAMKHNPVCGIPQLMGKPKTSWSAVGWLGVITSMLLMSYYIMLTGWMMAYFLKMAGGKLTGLDVTALRAEYGAFTGNIPQNVLFYGIVVVLLGMIVGRGIKNGIERICKVCLPVSLIILLVLAVRSLCLPGAMEGLRWYFHLDFSSFSMGTLLAAMGQAFFSIGIGVATAMVYGSYLDEKTDLIRDGRVVVWLVIGSALLSGLVVFPAVFAFGMEPAEGAALIFITLPRLFSLIPGGRFFGALFFLLVFLAGMLPGVGYLEAVVTAVSERFSLHRKKSTVIALTVISFLGIFSVLSFSVLQDFTPAGKSLFEWADFLSGNVMMPVTALLTMAFLVFVWKFSSFQHEVNLGAKGRHFQGKLASFWVTICIPVIVLVILIAGL